MNKYFAAARGAALAVAFVGLSAAAGLAATISGTFNLTGDAFANSSGLVTQTDTTSGNFSVNLQAGQSTSFTLFRVFTNEPMVDADDLTARSFLANFMLNTFGGGSVDGSVKGVKVGTLQYGQLAWLAPLVLTGPSGSLVIIDLSAGTFNRNNANRLSPGTAFGYDVVATVTYDIAAVPVPAAGGALAAALGLLGFMRRRRAA